MHSANTLSPEVFAMEALPILRTRTLFQYIVSHHSQYSVREHSVITPVVGALVHRVRALGQHSESHHPQYSVLEHCINTPCWSTLCSPY
jgi:hypothetical protein